MTIDQADGEWDSWALLNRTTGAIVTGGDDGTNSTESMIKAWIAADYLNGLHGAQPSAADTDLLRRMIRDSDNDAAETLYLRRGNDAVIDRLVSTCGLTDTTVHHGWWSLTQTSARDAVRMGDCIADGKATNPKWTAWLLNEMRQVEGEGNFGIVEVRPGVAIKNGWTDWGGYWHVNCLAVTDGWSLSVLTRYPDSLGLDHGAAVCRSVTQQLSP
ncbi:serine hydrolase [Planosporangium thailandense]|uniref:Serine hydrolase n=1 Tax=Planosporangium thailandense TaxID=765197 RepID=A0ABX0XYI6_9ACTN|nr:serine hydrolase [Planosporangium thailandense]